jgi:hypothetical protein
MGVNAIALAMKDARPLIFAKPELGFIVPQKDANDLVRIRCVWWWIYV